MIRKIKGKYTVLSEKTGRVFGRYNTKKEAEKRLRQVEYFKHLKKPGSENATAARHKSSRKQR